MSEIRFLLKFGKKEHIEEFVNGSLFCSNAETFWKIEKDKKIKGQGDILEGGSRIYAQRVVMQEPSSGRVADFNSNVDILVHYEPVKNIPVFCLFVVYDSDCCKDHKGNYSIRLSDETKDIIREHFPDADTVAIIACPKQFIEDVDTSIGCHIENGPVNYFNIDKGVDIGDGKVAMDMEYMKYLTQDVPPVKEKGQIKYVFSVDYVYRALFCKDIFFKQEQEYRIVLPNESISKGKHYPVKFSQNIQMMPLDEFMK